MTTEKRKAACWRFPQEDFPLYQAHCSDGYIPCKTYDDYTVALAEFADAMTDEGCEVVESCIGVESMLFALDEAGLTNCAESRAAIVTGV